MIFLVSYILLVKSMKWLISLSLGGDSERTSQLLARDLPYLPWATDYLWILLSAGLTVLVQSSSIVTSALVPLVSSKLVTLEVRAVESNNINPSQSFLNVTREPTPSLWEQISALLPPPS